MALNLKEKELVFLGASVAAGCKPCANYHFKQAREADASDEEIKQAISDAVYIRNGASAIMESHGLRLLGIIKQTDDDSDGNETNRTKQLVFMAAAFAVNCTLTLEKHIHAGKAAGITDHEIKELLDSVLFVKEKAASHVGKIAETVRHSVDARVESVSTGCCGS